MDTTRKELFSNLQKIEDYLHQLEEENARLLERIRYLEKQLEIFRKPSYTVAYVKQIVDDSHAIVRLSTGIELYVSIFPELDIKPDVGDMVLLARNNSTIIKVLKSVDRNEFFVVEKPRVTYNDIGGLKKQIEKIREVVELPLVKHELFERMGIEPPKGVLLYGPPGTGKTLLAKAVAHHAKANFIYVAGSEFARKYVGEGAELVRRLFKVARKYAPTIIFIDEIDAIGAKRIYSDSGAEREVSRTLNQLLAEMDGFRPSDRIVVIGATNRLDVLDPALLRPGRFDRVIEVPLPGYEDRKEIFQIYLSRVPHKDSIDLDKLAELTKGFSGADIELAVKEAAMKAIKQNRDYVTESDLLQAIEEIKQRKRKVEGLGSSELQRYRVSVY